MEDKKDMNQKENAASKNAAPNSIFLSNAQKGMISIGIVAGAALALSKKKGLLAIIGYSWLGSIAGGGIAYLFKKTDKQ